MRTLNLLQNLYEVRLTTALATGPTSQHVGGGALSSHGEHARER